MSTIRPASSQDALCSSIILFLGLAWSVSSSRPTTSCTKSSTCSATQPSPLSGSNSPGSTSSDISNCNPSLVAPLQDHPSALQLHRARRPRSSSKPPQRPPKLPAPTTTINAHQTRQLSVKEGGAGSRHRRARLRKRWPLWARPARNNNTKREASRGSSRRPVGASTPETCFYFILATCYCCYSSII